jgi:solute carrier family 35, member E1
MFTVMAYASFFRVKYSVATYASLLPLTAGVMLACSFDTSAADIIGLISAFGSAIVFVSSNIFFKKVMPSTPSGIGPTTVPSHKLDKINMLLYSSGLAFLLMIPIWISYDLRPLAALHYSSLVNASTSEGSGPSVPLYFFLNGTVHFAQNLIAFAILASTSPVTYSIASLIKRIAVICIAVVWFNQHVHPLQGAGICLTFLGLWMYNSAKADVERGENKRRRIEARSHLVLPISTRDSDLASSLPQWTTDEKVEWATDPPPYVLSSAITRQQHPTDTPGSSPASNSPRSLPNNNLRHPRPLDISSLEPLKALTGLPHAHAPPVLTGINIVHSPIRSYPSPPPSADSSSPSPPNEMLAYPPSPSSLKNRQGVLSHEDFDSGQDLLSALTSIGGTRPDGVRTQDERY